MGAAPIVAAPVLGKFVLGGDARAADEHLASHVHDHAAHGHAAMIGESAPAVGGPNDLDELLYPARGTALLTRAGCASTTSAPSTASSRSRRASSSRPGRTTAPSRGRSCARPRATSSASTSSTPARTRTRSTSTASTRPNQDGVFEIVESGDSFTYEFEARPAGFHPYHCHATPLKKHIHKGLYGSLIIDPKEPRPPAQELVMVMNGYDTDADGGNNFYTVNGRSFYYAKYPITVRRSQLVRIYLANLTEFDLINSFHLHADFFHYQPNGTGDYREYTDTVMQCQGQRGIIELEFANTGLFMFHAHQSEFAELGWMGFFNVVD